MAARLLDGANVHGSDRDSSSSERNGPCHGIVNRVFGLQYGSLTPAAGSFSGTSGNCSGSGCDTNEDVMAIIEEQLGCSLRQDS